MNRRIFCTTSLAALALAAAGRAATDDQITFHFYGALDCPPCMAFKRNHLADVQAEGRSLGFAVEENIIAKTRDVPNPGVYGDRDPFLRVAAPQLDFVYPPIFFVSKGGQIKSVHGHDWQAALEDAKRLAGQT
ncbi:hypothetical protein HW561_14670 [Rhodobacteraceae bacterium B1Z28]|uniref:Thioredoxin-like protein n=1 Tax=Ruegeria haliotis TaxID=2747601 RepID=A0ABX2PUI6_9RHOB|nr:hypothetical protein [Ruegeria haliotis]NVO57036.1 hypothetical protein [Ruegeria haliotis]